MTERGVAEQMDVRVWRGDQARTERAALGYGSASPFELVLGFGGKPWWDAWIVDISVAIVGTYCPPASPAGRGDVRIFRCSDTCVAVLLQGVAWTEEAHFPAPAFCGFVETVIEMYEDPAPVADAVLASQIDEWRSDAT